MILKDNLYYLSTSTVPTVYMLPMINLLHPDESNGMAAPRTSAQETKTRDGSICFFSCEILLLLQYSRGKGPLNSFVPNGQPVFLSCVFVSFFSKVCIGTCFIKRKWDTKYGRCLPNGEMPKIGNQRNTYMDHQLQRWHNEDVLTEETN